MPNKIYPKTSATSSSAFSALTSALRTVGTERQALEQVERSLLADRKAGLGVAFEEAIALLQACKGRVIVTGIGKSGHIARKIAATFASTGTPAYFVHPAEASHGDLGMIAPDDVILALSWSGEARELADIIAYARRFRVPLIAITSGPASALGRQANVRLVLPKAAEACPNGLAPTSSTTMTLVLGDALAVALLEARGFSADDFRVFHPGGKLGAQLTRVKAVMRTGDELPIVTAGTTLDATLKVLSSKGFGMAIVAATDGKLAGVLTDGDVRRNFGKDPLKVRVDEIMTRDPRTITANQLAGEALEQLNARKITTLVVTDEDKKPVGLVHIQDLLRLGVA
jgi:arabinose-5-phosphate isomerase